MSKDKVVLEISDKLRIVDFDNIQYALQEVSDKGKWYNIRFIRSRESLYTTALEFYVHHACGAIKQDATKRFYDAGIKDLILDLPTKSHID